MAPTEILAEQHFASLSALFAPLGVSAALLTGSMTGKQKKDGRERIAAGEVQVVIGTHALLSESTRFDNLGLVIIDYLQLMQGSGYGKNSDNRVTVVGEISRSLKIMAKELDVPVICLSQLSRAVESRTDKRPILSDLRESGAIEQDADSVMFLYRDEYYHENTEDKGVAECIVAKNRHGETGAVKMQWIGQYQTFADREWKHAE